MSGKTLLLAGPSPKALRYLSVEIEEGNVASVDVLVASCLSNWALETDAIREHHIKLQDDGIHETRRTLLSQVYLRRSAHRNSAVLPCWKDPVGRSLFELRQ